MGFGIKLMVWGEFASFNRPEMKVERVSYDVMTPSAARGVLTAIYWKPEMKWVVDEIWVFKPVQFTQIRRNELSCKIPQTAVRTALSAGRGNLGVAIEDNRQQRAAMILRDVAYGIRAHIEVIKPDTTQTPGGRPEAKHLEMFKRRATKGQYFHHPYLGVREFPASFELVDDFPPVPPELRGDRDLGFMLHDMVFVTDKKGPIVDAHSGEKQRAEARFFRAKLQDGVIRVPPLAEARG